MLTAKEITDRLVEHDDRVIFETPSCVRIELRMLGSMTDGNADFVVFVILSNGVVKELFNNDCEDEAIKCFQTLVRDN